MAAFSGVIIRAVVKRRRRLQYDALNPIFNPDRNQMRMQRLLEREREENQEPFGADLPTNSRDRPGGFENVDLGNGDAESAL